MARTPYEESCMRLRNTTEMVTIRAALQAKLDKIKTLLMHKDGTELMHLQGRAQQLTELLTDLNPKE